MCFQCYECGEIPGARDRLLREHVEWKIAIMDAGRYIVELAAEIVWSLRTPRRAFLSRPPPVS